MIVTREVIGFQLCFCKSMDAFFYRFTRVFSAGTLFALHCGGSLVKVFLGGYWVFR